MKVRTDANVRALSKTLHLSKVVEGERKGAKDPPKTEIPGAARLACGTVLEMGVHKRELCSQEAGDDRQQPENQIWELSYGNFSLV